MIRRAFRSGAAAVADRRTASSLVPTLLVTGHLGFAGQAVRARLAGGAPGAWSAVTLADGFDIRDAALGAAVAELRPDAVLHLAALTSVAESFRDPDLYFDVNFRGTHNLLRALQACGFSGRMIHVSSGDCYGSVAAADLPVAESQPLRPRSPYAVSKVAAEALAFQWSQSEGLDVVIARPFNHIGPGQGGQFVIPSLARQVAAARAGKAARIVTGDLDVTRDFTDVRDVVDAYLALLARGRRGEAYNIGSGREQRIGDLLDGLLRGAGIEVPVETDPARLRPGEQRRMCANIAKIRADTGWAPRIALEATLRDILADAQGEAGR